MAVKDYDTVPANNTSISGIPVTDQTLVSSVDDIFRQIMADVKAEYVKTINAISVIETAGTASAFTATPKESFATYEAGMSFMVNFHVPVASGAVTIDLGPGPRPLKRRLATASKADPFTAAVHEYTTAIITYDGTDFVIETGLAARPNENRTGMVKVLHETDLASAHDTWPPTQGSVKTFFEGRSIGINQTWVNETANRTANVSYQNTGSSPMFVSIDANSTDSLSRNIQVSSDGTTWVTVGKTNTSAGGYTVAHFIVPPGHYYRINGSAGIKLWSELK